MSNPARPYLRCLAVCEKVIEDKAGSLTLVRVIDVVTTTVPVTTPFSVNIQLVAVASVKAGDARGPHRWRVGLLSPSGKELVTPPAVATVEFQDAEGGLNLMLNLMIEPQDGMYWLELYLNDESVPFGRSPFRVVVRRP